MTFEAPWSRKLKWISGLTTLLLIGVSGFIFSKYFSGADDEPAVLLAAILPLVVVLGALAFTIRGYEIRRDGLKVHRLLWATHFPLDGLQRAWADPEAMAHSIRLFGNGGLYSFSGLFRNKKLGTFRAFATHRKGSVVIDCGKRKIVVTPDRPERMLGRLKELWPDAEISE